MRILIDGYNLLFQSGLGGRSRGPGWIQRARDQLIGFLHSQMDDYWTAGTVIVFDKSQGKETQHDKQTERGLKIIFAVEHPEADDLIEELIQAHSSPKSLIVVSSDLRVRRRATTRRAQSLDSETFLRKLESGQFAAKPPDSDKAPDPIRDDASTLSDHEVQFWLREFGDL
ncbi:MAG: NYN domain-containing protein [Hyphomonas sp.]|nr:NYN domain-containing protein [Hyphomonas sp.]